MLRVLDRQIPWRYFWEGHIFKNKREVIEALADYHDIDWDWSVEEEPEMSLIERLDEKYKKDKSKLERLCVYWDWELEYF